MPAIVGTMNEEQAWHRCVQRSANQAAGQTETQAIQRSGTSRVQVGYESNTSRTSTRRVPDLYPTCTRLVSCLSGRRCLTIVRQLYHPSHPFPLVSVVPFWLKACRLQHGAGFCGPHSRHPGPIHQAAQVRCVVRCSGQTGRREVQPVLFVDLEGVRLESDFCFVVALSRKSWVRSRPLHTRAHARAREH